jgi:hypothetical protein
MIHYLNNSQTIDHADFYKEVTTDAFFDLYTTGRDKKYIPHFQIGDVCIVASKVRKAKASIDSNDEAVAIKRYRLENTLVHPYKPGLDTFVLCGSHIDGESMPKSHAALHEKYGIFFNCLGHFKRVSVLHRANDP